MRRTLALTVMPTVDRQMASDLAGITMMNVVSFCWAMLCGRFSQACAIGISRVGVDGLSVDSRTTAIAARPTIKNIEPTLT